MCKQQFDPTQRLGAVIRHAIEHLDLTDLVPHLVRMLFGSDNTVVLPASAIAGALVLIWADLAARLIMAPEDLPIGVVTGLVGGLAFIWLMRRA